MAKTVLFLPGDGIGPEILTQAERIFDAVNERFGLQLHKDHALVGGCAIDDSGHPLPATTLQKAQQADAILLGAVGGPQWDQQEMSLRPEKGLLGLRANLNLFANLRPAILYPQLAAASSLKAELVAGLDLLIVRELTGGIYFGEPRGLRTNAAGEREGFNTYVYSEAEIRRIGRVAFAAAQNRSGRLCSVDKANVLEATVLWRQVMNELAADYPDVELSHLYVDNAAMQLVRAPKQFDVMVTGNMFGDILSDCAAMLTGSIGMLPSAALDAENKGMYEPIHGSAPDIAGQNTANPIAAILSLAMLLRYSMAAPAAAVAIEQAVSRVLDQGLRTVDIYAAGCERVSTEQMGAAVLAALELAEG